MAEFRVDFHAPQHIFVVGRDDTAHSGHATVAQFDVLAITCFEQQVMPWEMLVDQAEELLSNIDFHTLTEWRVKPRDLSFPGKVSGWYVNFSLYPLCCKASL